MQRSAFHGAECIEIYKEVLMSKVIIFNGSPRKKGAISQVIAEVARGVQEAGAEVKIYDLNQPNIKGCQGCMYCKSNKGVCCQQDVLKSMYQEIAETDAIVFGSPIYMFKISGQAKIWMDRLYALVDQHHKAVYPGKKVLTIYAQGAPVSFAFLKEKRHVKHIFKILGWKETKRITTGSRPDIYPAKISAKTLSQAFMEGKKLVR